MKTVARHGAAWVVGVAAAGLVWFAIATDNLLVGMSTGIFAIAWAVCIGHPNIYRHERATRLATALAMAIAGVTGATVTGWLAAMRGSYLVCLVGLGITFAVMMAIPHIGKRARMDGSENHGRKAKLPGTA
jgi:hypothetical protein